MSRCCVCAGAVAATLHLFGVLAVKGDRSRTICNGTMKGRASEGLARRTAKVLATSELLFFAEEPSEGVLSQSLM